jgi:hypothetical protein
MSSFNFNETAGAAQSTSRPALKGNNIYDVTFDGIEIKDMAGKKDPNAMYNVLNIKFSNKDGWFTHTIFEPREEDGVRRETIFKDDKGVENKVPQLSNNEVMMLIFKHLIDAVNPELGVLIDKGEAGTQMKITGNDPHSTWLSLRNVMKAATEPGIGTEVKLKLIANKKGEAIFPYFAAIDKEGKKYMKFNFIGNNVFWNAKEIAALKKVAAAKPTRVGESFDLTMSSSAPTEDLGMDADMDFKL